MKLLLINPYNFSSLIFLIKSLFDKKLRDTFKKVSTDGNQLENIISDYRYDKTIVLTAVRQRGASLRFAPPRFRNDKKIVLEALNNILAYDNAYDDEKELVFELISSDLKKDQDIMLVASKINGEFLKFADCSIKSCKEIIIEAVKEDFRAIEYASDDLKNDKDVFLIANDTWGGLISLQHFSESIKGDKDLVLSAVKKNGLALKYASDRLKNDREIVLESVKCKSNSPWALYHSADHFKDDYEVVMQAVVSVGWALKFASDRLKTNREIVLTAVKQNGYALEHAPDSFRNDKEIVVNALQSNPYSITFVSENLKNDYEIISIIKQQ